MREVKSRELKVGDVVDLGSGLRWLRENGWEEVLGEAWLSSQERAVQVAGNRPVTVESVAIEVDPDHDDLELAVIYTDGHSLPLPGVAVVQIR